MHSLSTLRTFVPSLVLASSLLGATPAAQVIDPGDPTPNLSGAEEIDAAIAAFNSYYGGTVSVASWHPLIVIPDEAVRQFTLDYLILNVHYPTGSVWDPASLVPTMVSGDPSIGLPQLTNLKIRLDGVINVGDTIAVIEYQSADIGSFANLAVYNTSSIRYAPILSNVRLPANPTAGGTLDYIQPYLWGDNAEQFGASLVAVCEGGDATDCLSSCDAVPTLFSDAAIACASSGGGACCELEYQFGFATAFKSVSAGAGLSFSGEIGQDGSYSGTLQDCCE